MKKWVFVGHRGVGKSEVLEQLDALAEGLSCIDLDIEIEKYTDQSIADIFKSKGESYFRDIEKKVFSEVSVRFDKKPHVISLGAGFEGSIPDEYKVVWLQRATDSWGRVFLQRPLLDKRCSPLEDYLNRFSDREAKYKQQCDFELELPEGGHPRQGSFVAHALGIQTSITQSGTAFDFTLPAESLFQWDHFLEVFGKRLRYFELRDDLLSLEEAQEFISRVSDKKVLISCRHKGGWGETFLDRPEFLLDWPSEFGACPRERPHILSSHQKRGEIVDRLDTVEELKTESTFAIKCAFEIESWEELQAGHDWWKSDPNHRSFLPISSQGRWNWYRRVFGKKMPLNFMRWGRSEGAILDQPSFFEVFSASHLVSNSSHFAAVLGAPIRHSRSPSFHWDFFNSYNMDFVPIQLLEEEWNEGLRGFLLAEGLKFAAVTSPLKTCLAKSVSSKDTDSSHSIFCEEEDLAESSVNTWLVSEKGESYFYNTDVYGLRAQLSHIGPEESVVLWGGGGTRLPVKSVLPQAISYSARRGEPRSEEVSVGLAGPEVLIWAVGRKRHQECVWPPETWRPKKIVDLNYSEDSPGKEYALKVGGEYFGGLKMFEAQALRQQEIFKSLVKKSLKG